MGKILVLETEDSRAGGCLLHLEFCAVPKDPALYGIKQERSRSKPMKSEIGQKTNTAVGPGQNLSYRCDVDGFRIMESGSDVWEACRRGSPRRWSS